MKNKSRSMTKKPRSVGLTDAVWAEIGKRAKEISQREERFVSRTMVVEEAMSEYLTNRAPSAKKP
jgi:hypothetical protein